MDYQQILKDIYQEIQPYASIGKQADYIPALAKINPDQFGMCIHTIQNKTFMHGATGEKQWNTRIISR